MGLSSRLAGRGAHHRRLVRGELWERGRNTGEMSRQPQENLGYGAGSEQVLVRKSKKNVF